jgi:hypothetical protein
MQILVPDDLRPSKAGHGKVVDQYHVRAAASRPRAERDLLPAQPTDRSHLGNTNHVSDHVAVGNGVASFFVANKHRNVGGMRKRLKTAEQAAQTGQSTTSRRGERVNGNVHTDKLINNMSLPIDQTSRRKPAHWYL